MREKSLFAFRDFARLVLCTSTPVANTKAVEEMPPRKKTKLTKVVESPAGSPQPEEDGDEVEREERYQFPTVRPGQALVDSYTFHSDSIATSSSATEEEEKAGKEGEEWMLGVDEAGRGPALGGFCSYTLV